MRSRPIRVYQWRQYLFELRRGGLPGTYGANFLHLVRGRGLWSIHGTVRLLELRDEHIFRPWGDFLLVLRCGSVREFIPVLQLFTGNVHGHVRRAEIVLELPRGLFRCQRWLNELLELLRGHRGGSRLE